MVPFNTWVSFVRLYILVYTEELIKADPAFEFSLIISSPKLNGNENRLNILSKTPT